MSAATPDHIYKIVTGDVWRQAKSKSKVPPMPVDRADGYIHFSTAEQLHKTLSLHFTGQGDLVILAVKTASVSDCLKWEASRGGSQFPHLYGALPTKAIVWHKQIDVSADGTCALPECVR